MSVVVMALVVLSRLKPIPKILLISSWINLPSSSASDALLELKGIVCSANRAKYMSFPVSPHFRMVFLTVWTV